VARTGQSTEAGMPSSLGQLEANLAGIIDRIIEGLIMLNANGDVLFANRAAEMMLISPLLSGNLSRSPRVAALQSYGQSRSYGQCGKPTESLTPPLAHLSTLPSRAGIPKTGRLSVFRDCADPLLGTNRSGLDDERE
jgi:hypothetical protein